MRLTTILVIAFCFIALTSGGAAEPIKHDTPSFTVSVNYGDTVREVGVDEIDFYNSEILFFKDFKQAFDYWYPKKIFTIVVNTGNWIDSTSCFSVESPNREGVISTNPYLPVGEAIESIFDILGYNCPGHTTLVPDSPLYLNKAVFLTSMIPVGKVRVGQSTEDFLEALDLKGTIPATGINMICIYPNEALMEQDAKYKPADFEFRNDELFGIFFGSDTLPARPKYGLLLADPYALEGLKTLHAYPPLTEP